MRKYLLIALNLVAILGIASVAMAAGAKLDAPALGQTCLAAALGIGAESVKTHLKGIMTKLGCPNATSAVSRAYELGILRA